MTPSQSQSPNEYPNAAQAATGGSLLRWLQLRMIRGLALSPEQQRRTVRGMMVRAPDTSVSYWLQLCLSVGIATLGLVLNSGGVVIGAMLIAPLMGPIVELAMALTVGSPYLMLRSLLRAGLSIVVAVAGSAAINLALPFHEVTSEIAARTTPTAIDLFVAIFCAFAAAFSTVRSSSETVATAAGTSISIALVPPLCVVGFGIGNLQWSVATGAALLFVANLSAILMFAALFFLFLGFDRIAAEPMEQEARVEDSWLGQLSARLWLLFGHRYGSLFRVLIPLSLVGAVYIPLSRALASVAWEVRVRGSVQRILDAEIPSDRSVQTTVIVQNQQVSLRVVLVAKPEKAKEIEQRLRLRIAQAAGVEPTIGVLSVPDEQTIRETALILGRPKSIPIPLPPPEPDFALLHRRLATVLKAEWPGAVAGAILRWQVRFEEKRMVVELSHLGSALGPAAEVLLNRRLSAALGTEVKLVDRMLDANEHSFSLDEPTKYWPELLRATTSVTEYPELTLCLGLPAVVLSKKPTATETQRQASLAAIQEHVKVLGTRAVVQPSDALRVHLQDVPCEGPPPSDGGADPRVDGGSQR